MTLGGRAAEELVFGRITTGAQNDLERITKLAYSMISIYGMNKKVGNLSYYDPNNEYSFSKPYSEQTAKVMGASGRVVLITIPTGEEPELKTQLDAFRQTLKKLGNYELKEHELDTKDQPKYGAGMGLSGRRFERIPILLR